MKKTTVLVGLVLCLAPVARAQLPERVGQNATCTTVDGKQVPCPICVVDGVRAVCPLLRSEGRAGLEKSAEDPFAPYLFPPELVMAHQQAIGLTDRQRAAIQEAMKEAQIKFPEIQFKMSAEAEKLQQLIQGTAVDETKVIAQVDRVLTLEREVKHTQLTLMIRIKNQLTEQQQAALGKLRNPPRDDGFFEFRVKKPSEP